MVSPDPQQIKPRSLAQLVHRAREQTDVSALLALCRELAERLLDADKILGRDVRRRLTTSERLDLEMVMGMPRCDVLPPGPTLPLSKMQARLVSLLEVVGPEGAKTRYVIQKLWRGFKEKSNAKNNLRQLISKTNSKLRNFDPHRRRIYRRTRDVLALKTLAKR